MSTLAELSVFLGFKFTDVEEAYQTFGLAAQHQCLKVLIEMD